MTKPGANPVARQSVDLVQENIARLQELFPEVVSEGKVDFEKLKGSRGTISDRSVMFEILFENEDLIAVNKPEGLSSIPERQPGQKNDSLYEMLCAQRGEMLYIVHRIDKDTSGVIVFAKSAAAHCWLGRQFERRTVQKVYLALVHGVVAAEQGVIDKPLGQFGSGRMGVNPQHGRSAYTEYLVLHRFAAHTLVEAYPKTGRRHQIRVHFYSLGHAIVGDRVYGNLPIQRTYPRMMLHAHRLTLRLPDGGTPNAMDRVWEPGQPLTLETPPPESFEKVIQMINAPRQEV